MAKARAGIPPGLLIALFFLAGAVLIAIVGSALFREEEPLRAPWQSPRQSVSETVRESSAQAAAPPSESSAQNEQAPSSMPAVEDIAPSPSPTEPPPRPPEEDIPVPVSLTPKATPLDLEPGQFLVPVEMDEDGLPTGDNIPDPDSFLTPPPPTPAE